MKDYVLAIPFAWVTIVFLWMAWDRRRLKNKCRDRFTEAALTGLCAAIGPNYSPSFVIDTDGIAKDAVSLADLVIEELK